MATIERPSGSPSGGIVRKALADALRKGSVTRNVADLADPPKPSAGRKAAVHAWTPAQLRQFLDEIASHRLYPAVYLAANTGMRRGEVLGLRWKDVDLDRCRLSVQQALVNIAYELEFADVKTQTSRRTIDLDERTIAVLRAWRKKQLEERLLVGRRDDEAGLVFTQPDGSPVHPDYFSQVFERHVSKSQLPRIRLHDLRHTHATILLQAGVPVKVVSERLGHSSPAFTMSVYQHVLPGMQADAAATFSEVVFETPSTQ
jgi:integrase